MGGHGHSLSIPLVRIIDYECSILEGQLAKQMLEVLCTMEMMHHGIMVVKVHGQKHNLSD